MNDPVEDLMGRGGLGSPAMLSLPDGHDATLQALVERLRESEARFRTMADCAPVLLWMAETDGLCTFFNKVWLDWTGRTMEQEYGNGWAEGVHAEDFEPCMHTYLEAFVRRQPFRMEYRLRRADGAYRWILDTGVPRFGPSGQFAGYIGSCLDITEIKDAHLSLQRMNQELERRVEERTAQLRHTNEELEQFAYIASHDLQAPLRSITAYIRLLQKRYAGKLDADADDFIRFIVEGATHMRSLIQDLLAYSRASRVDATQAPVDCARLLRHIVDALAATIRDKGASVVVDPLPVILGDETLLGQVFQNLVDNGIKFCRDRAPQVRVSCTRQGPEHVFSVADNGIGIPPEHQGRLFRMFQRLHPQEEFSGTGIGLAVCKRAIERHGGRIWIESVGAQGTVFRFTIPAEPHAQAQ